MIHPDTKTKRGDPTCHSLCTEEILPHCYPPFAESHNTFNSGHHPAASNKKISNVMRSSILKHMKKITRRGELESRKRVQEARRELG